MNYLFHINWLILFVFFIFQRLFFLSYLLFRDTGKPIHICFQYLEPKPGNFVSIEDGTVMGTHKGMIVVGSLQTHKQLMCHNYFIMQTECNGSQYVICEDNLN